VAIVAGVKLWRRRKRIARALATSAE